VRKSYLAEKDKNLAVTSAHTACGDMAQGIAWIDHSFNHAFGPNFHPFTIPIALAGVRRSELVRVYAEDQVLEWEDVDWQKHLITVRHEVAKQTSRKMGNRRSIPMEAALLHWLGPYRKEEGLLIPLVDSAVRRRMKKLCLHSRVNPPNNALRHSYASYWLARSSKEGLASDHKYLRICDLCQEQAFGTKRWPR
jgi:hypothetical protein